MAELSAIPFNKLPSADDGYTVLYENNQVCRSEKKLSELVGDKTSAFLTQEQGDRLYQEKGDYLVNDDITGKLDKSQYAADSATFLTAHQDISNKLDTTAFSTVSGNFLTEQDLNGYATEEWVKAQNYITGVDLNGYATEDWVKAQNYITGVDLSNYYQKTETSGKDELSAKFDNVEAKITALETILATYSGLWVLTNTPE